MNDLTILLSAIDRGERNPNELLELVYAELWHQSVGDQLAGKSESKSLGGGFSRPGGGGGDRGFGIGGFLAPVWSKAADSDANGQITAAEFLALPSRRAREWDSDRNASLNETELRDGLGKAFPPPSPNGQPRR